MGRKFVSSRRRHVGTLGKSQKRKKIPLECIAIFGFLLVTLIQMMAMVELMAYRPSTVVEIEKDLATLFYQAGGQLSSNHHQQQGESDAAVAIASASASKQQQPLKSLLYKPDQVFIELVQEAKAFSPSLPNQVNCMVVGVHGPYKCAQAAKASMISHCIEPSPMNRDSIENGINQLEEEYRKNIRFYQLAGSDTSGLDLEFLSGGGGGVDMFHMTKTEQTPEQKIANREKIVTVKSVAIDDILKNKIEPTIDYQEKVTGTKSQDTIDRLYLLKVDVQAHEPDVFAGVQESIQGHKIDFILFEYWPKGMDFLKDALGTDQECKVPVRMLQTMMDAGYTLYSLRSDSHPSAPIDQARKMIVGYNRGKITDHLKSLEDHCKWYYELEKHRQTMEDGTKYERGYWTDILAVRPGFSFPNPPTTQVGKLLMGS